MKEGGKPWWRLARVLAVSVIAFLWARALRDQWGYLQGYPWQLRWPLLAAALGLLLAQMVLLGTAWWRLLADVGASLSWRRGAGMWLQSQMARYVPGGMWDVVARAVIGRGWEVSLREISAAAVLEVAFQVTTSATVLVALLASRPPSGWEPYIVGAGAAVVSLWGGLFTSAFPRGVNWLLRRLGKEPVGFVPASSRVLVAAALYLAAHACQGMAFALFVAGLSPVSASLMPLLAAAYVAAWLVGYVVVVAPTGIGVREGVVVLLLADALPVPLVIAAALSFRVWLTVRDALAALVGVLLLRRSQAA